MGVFTVDGRPASGTAGGRQFVSAEVLPVWIPGGIARPRSLLLLSRGLALAQRSFFNHGRAAIRVPSRRSDPAAQVPWGICKRASSRSTAGAGRQQTRGATASPARAGALACRAPARAWFQPGRGARALRGKNA